jgi:uncharacterized RDD family membrane protein YckC
MACPLCGDRCTCSFTPGSTGRGASAPSSLTYEYDDEYRDREQLNPEPQHHAVNDDPAPSAQEHRAHSSELNDPMFTTVAAPPEDLSLESARTDDPEEIGPMWKQEVSSRLENYRARRGSRRPRYNASMSLDFDRAVNRMMSAAIEEEATWEKALSPAQQEDPAPSVEDANEFFGATAEAEEAQEFYRRQATNDEAAEQPTNKIIEFPRLPTLFDMSPTGNELAEQVVDKPRILYVPEEVPTAQAPLADFQLDSEERTPYPDVELPLCIAPMGQRAFAGLVDGFIVFVGAVIFMAIALRAVPAPDTKAGYALVTALPVMLWAIYEYLFLVHCAVTPGMQLARLVLASFDGEPVGRSERRGRALACMLSTFPLGLGLVWALLDEDTLCWHDRITRTYLASKTSQN